MGTTVTNKNGIEFDIDAIATDVNGKMDKDGVNATCPVVISRTPNNQGGVVEIWSDGYCVQNGVVSGSGTFSAITLQQSYKDNNFNAFATCISARLIAAVVSKTSTSIVLSLGQTYNTAGTGTISWRTEGYIR